MDIKSFIENLQSQNISLFSFFIFLVISLAIIFFLGALTFRFSKKIKDLSKQRYGFGGKPIFSFLIVVGVTVAIPLTLYASYRSIEMINYARAEKDAFIEINSERIDQNLHSVYFIAVPLVNGIAWENQNYTMSWKIEGPISFEKIEEGRNSKNTSYFVKELPDGEYLVSVEIKNESFYVKKELTFTLE